MYTVDSNFVHTFAGNPLDRAQHLRKDQAALGALQRSDTSRFLVFHQLKVATNASGSLAWIPQSALPSELKSLVFLGLKNGAGHFAASLAAEVTPSPIEAFSDCRQAVAGLSVEDAGIVSQARAMLDWHQRNPYCAVCGNPSRASRGGQVRQCDSCNKHIFPRTDPVAIMLIQNDAKGEFCLLGKSQGRMAQSNFYSALAGFVDQGESLEEAVRREGDDTDENGNPIRGKTKEWVVTREVSIQPGDPFNRNELERVIKRLYATQLFSDVKVTLRPVPQEPGEVVIVLGIVEQSTGQLSGGLGYSQSQGVFGQMQLQETNFLGRGWNVGTNITYGQYGGLANLNFSDPWIYGDKHRTSFRTSLFLSQQVPQVFQSEENGNIRTVKGYINNGSNSAYETGRAYTNVNGGNAVPDDVNLANDAALAAGDTVSWFDYEGDTVVLRKTGGSFSFSRPLNGGNPYKDAKWNVVAGMSFAEVRPINFAGESRPYGVSSKKRGDGNGVVDKDEIVCVAYNCADSNTLIGARFATTYNTLNNPRNPTSGNFFSAGTEQFLGINSDSPTFNRLRASYTQFFPVDWLKLHKGCRPKPGEQADCPQAIGVQIKGGAIMGEAPPYEAFCIGGSNSIRGWYNCDLAVSKAFSEVTIEYRFPLISIFSGELFMDAGTDFGTQADVPGEPGLLLNKEGSGVSVGTGVIVTTPVGPIRLEMATKNFSSDYRFNLGVGWKF